MGEPVWVRDDVVSAIHSRQLAEHGGSTGVRDAGLLASALARPKHRLAYAHGTVDLASLAASYAYGIIKNHPFVDGNKRTAAVVCELFLELNSQELTASDEEIVPNLCRARSGSAVGAKARSVDSRTRA